MHRKITSTIHRPCTEITRFSAGNLARKMKSKQWHVLTRFRGTKNNLTHTEGCHHGTCADRRRTRNDTTWHVQASNIPAKICSTSNNWSTFKRARNCSAKTLQRFQKLRGATEVFVLVLRGAAMAAVGSCWNTQKYYWGTLQFSGQVHHLNSPNIIYNSWIMLNHNHVIN